MLGKRIVVLFVVLGLLVMVPLAMAMPDPFATLVVWPVGEEGEGPLVTMSPADLIIYNNDASHVLDDLWLLLVANEDAYDNLVSVSTNTSLTFLPEHFLEIPGTEDPEYTIPIYTSDPGTTPLPPPYAYRPNGWPGIEPNDQYNVGSIRSKMGIPAGESMYYSVGDLDDSTGWVDRGPVGLNKGDPDYFTLTVTSGGDWKVLVMALGHSTDYPDTPILNVHSPYTKSTLTIVSEPGTILIALASISALGLYGIRHKMKKKPAP